MPDTYTSQINKGLGKFKFKEWLAGTLFKTG